jgi:ribosomal protein uL24
MTKKGKIIQAYFSAPLHAQSKRLSAGLSDSLREKYGIASMRIRKDDVVKIMSGEYKDVEGKVTHIHISDSQISVEGVTKEKLSGGTAPVKIHTSNVMITSLELHDKYRSQKVTGQRSET